MTALYCSNKTVHCAACNAEFFCGADAAGTCWCADLPRLPARALTAGGCLCEACLRTRIERAADAETPQPAAR